MSRQRAPSTTEPLHDLQEGDLLGSWSFEEEDQPSSSAVASSGRSPRSAPIHVKLPPRPSDISPEHPAQSPRRLSQSYAFAGPSSPPLLSDIGRDIIFHPTVEEVQSRSPRRRPSFNSWTSGSPKRQDSSAHSKLLDTLTSTQKLASKWRHAAESSLQSEQLLDLSPDITHSTPFASQQQVAGSYIPPSGAPGFRPVAPSHPIAVETELSRLRLRGRRDDVAAVMQQEDADSLRPYLPPRQRLEGTWTLQFSLDQHGSSLSTLYRLTERTPRGVGNILMALAANGTRFGVFLNEAIVRREGSYYGTGEAFLYKMVDGKPRVFAWTGRNQYFALCETGFISFGGGGGAYGLILDSTFNRNSSATSPAFDNEVLCDAGDLRSDSAQRFDCVGLEVWSTA